MRDKRAVSLGWPIESGEPLEVRTPRSSASPTPWTRAGQGEVNKSLLADLAAFLQEHRRCGDLDSGLDGDRVWMACSTCGAVINRCADDD
jgi:hypothetical protein